MVRVSHTEWPASRKNEATKPINQVKAGGICHKDWRDGVLEKALKAPKRRKDEVLEACKIFWIIAVGCAIFYTFYQIVK